MDTYQSSYTFNKMTNLGSDSCCIDQNTIQNTQACNYLTQNYFASDCSMQKPIDLATIQPGIMYTGGYGLGSGGCNVDTSSQLLIGTINTHPKCKIDLFARPFATVPYLGRGMVNPVVESQIQQGEQHINKKSVLGAGEKSSFRYQQIPLIPETKQMFDNYSTSIYTNNSNGFINGGIPTRELNRDNK